MRIISKLRDYYDGVLAFGQDQTVVFVRDSKELDAEKDIPSAILKLFKNRYAIYAKRSKVAEFTFSWAGVLFCGTWYPCIRAKRKMLDLDPISRTFKEEVKVFYTTEQLLEYYAENELKVPKPYSWLKTSFKSDLEMILKPHVSVELTNFCIGNRIVTLTAEQMREYGEGRYSSQYTDVYRVVANAPIEALQFYRVKNAFEAYQEIDMFVSGVLTSAGAGTVEISDKDRLQQHGFNKQSFRKAKEL